MKTIDLNAIQKEIHDNYLDLRSGILDVYEFIGKISKKYFKPVDEEWNTRVEENPYLDMLFSLLEINKIELY